MCQGKNREEGGGGGGGGEGELEVWEESVENSTDFADHYLAQCSVCVCVCVCV